jgi:SAM-dependent methyltransferase
MTVNGDLTEAVRYNTETFNGAVASAAISAAWQIGLLDELTGDAAVDLGDFAAEHDLHTPTVAAIAFALSARMIVDLDRDASVARPGPAFAETYRTKGLYLWLTGGSGNIFTALPELVSRQDRTHRRLERDAATIGVACRDVARTLLDPTVDELLADVTFRTVADLGCGSADRIIALARRHERARAIGVDIAPGALAVAGKAVAEAGLTDRVSLIRDDALDLGAHPGYAEVDLLMSFLMGHDFWPREECVRRLRRLREVFPRAGTFILADTARSSDVRGADIPLFTPGFELIHAVMDQYLPTLAEWDSVLAESGWRCVERRLVDPPAFTFVAKLVPA